ncbi:hypothetical protein ACH46_11245 [Gordonia phthalatica]|uniref:Uncharacterized protein n=1 Tax=Gordonia phthalatica TaxID=1136941 RepID=A0A0N7FUP9_9ACTN|nr:hypothetical protein ACH46_11245 [Gordonia phthalatica]
MLAALAGTVALAGCEVSGTAHRVPVDVDAGQYKTVKTDAGVSSPRWMAGAELAAYVPFPSEIDDTMIRTTNGTAPAATLKNLGAHIDGAEKVPENAEFQFGFAAGGNNSDPTVEGSPNTRSLGFGVFRYTDAGAARAAVRPTAEANRAELIATRDRFDLEKVDVLVDDAGVGFPAGSMTVSSEASGRDTGMSTRVLVPHGRDVLMVHSYGRSAADTASTLKRSVDLMIERLAGSADVSEKSAMRNASFVTLTVPFLGDGDRMFFDGTAVGPASYAHIYHDKKRGSRLLSQAGVDLIGQRETVVFRASSPAKASELRTGFETWRREVDAGSRKAASPRDLPTATCVEDVDSATDKSYGCTVVVGRYYATASSRKSLLDAQQKISAQYLILKERG